MHELGTRMSAYEFGEWWALYQQEPWSDARADIAAGVVASTFANCHRAQHARPFTPLDFAPFLKPREEPEEMTATALLKERRG